MPITARIALFFTRLFGRRDGNRGATGSPPPPPNAVSKKTETPPGNELEKLPAPAPTEPQPQLEESIVLSLKAITDRFPADLQGAIRKQPSEHVRIRIARGKIESQLARGAARITFADLRAASGEVFFSTNDAHDQTAVLLPLHEILAQIKLTRRSDQKHAKVPANIAPVFTRNTGDPRAGAPAADAIPSWYSPPKPTYNAVPAEGNAAPVVEKKPAFHPPREQEGKNAPAALVMSDETAVVPQPEKVSSTLFDPDDCIEVSLLSIMEALPKRVLNELDTVRLADVMLQLSLRELEPGIRQGRIVFQWKQLRKWLSQPVQCCTEFDATIELPLPLIVPLFLAAKKSASVRPTAKRVEVNASIPDIFSTAKSGATPTVPAIMLTPEDEADEAEIVPVEPVEQSGAVVLPHPPAESAASRLAIIPASDDVPTEAPCVVMPSSILDALPVPNVDGTPHVTPEEIVARAFQTPGVSGAFLATHDGLFIAGNTPGLNSRTMAAFVPNIFSQCKAYVTLAKLGHPESVLIALPDRTLQIFRCAKLFLGVLGEAGTVYPAAELSRLAAEIHHTEHTPAI